MKRRFFAPALCFLAIACSDEPEDPMIEALALVTTTLPGVDIGDEYDAMITARGGVPPYAFAVTEGELPFGIELTPSGALIGLAGRPGTSQFTVQVRDTQNKTATSELSIIVRPDPLEIAAVVLPMAREGSGFQQQLTARGGTAPHTWSVVQGALPSGVTLSTAGLIEGTPSQSGSFDFTVEVADSAGMTAERELHLTVISLNPMIDTTELERGRLGVPYQQVFAAEGGSPPYSWTIAAGSLPAGMNLSTDGQLAGTPTDSGIFNITVQVVDAGSHQDTRDFTLMIIAPLRITTTQLNQAIHDRPYSFQVQAAGGVAPYTWTLGAGTLPPGITFNGTGIFSGTSPNVGDFPLTIRVTDGESFTQSVMLTLRVSDRFTFDATPALTFPAVCTGTTVAFTAAALEVVDSMQIEDLNVAIDVQFPEATKLKIILDGPMGRSTTLCGADSWNGCQPGQLVREYDDQGAVANRPVTPLAAFNGYNPIGRWRLIVLVINPQCGQSGTINSFALTVEDDRDPTDYVSVQGWFPNNLINSPWVRIDAGTGDNGVPEHELFLSATRYAVGANGFREGGLGDDVPDPNLFTWGWLSNSISGTIVEPSGYVHAGETTGMATIIATDGNMDITMNLLVVPPDWQPAR